MGEWPPYGDSHSYYIERESGKATTPQENGHLTVAAIGKLILTPQENGHLTVAAVGKLILVVILWEPWRPPFILLDYGLLLAVRTELYT
jgi:hypothetical protein